MSDIVTWLRAQLDVDERLARAAAATTDGGSTWAYRPTSAPRDFESVVDLGQRLVFAEVDRNESGFRPTELEHIARHDPARVLAEVAAKRQMLDEYERAFDEGGELHQTLVRIMKLLALPYAGREGYREGWRP